MALLDGAEVPKEQRLAALRAIDKKDRLGLRGVQQLLAEKRKDESGDFTIGAGLTIGANNIYDQQPSGHHFYHFYFR